MYFMPNMAVRIMKLDPYNNYTMVSVGDDLEVGDNINVYISTVVGIDGCVYGIPSEFNHIVKYNPNKGSTFFVEGEADENLEFRGNGNLGRDRCIYAANCNSRVLKIDSTKINTYCIVSNTYYSDHGDHGGWGDGILGVDGCIYWPPAGAAQILNYDPHSNVTSLVGGRLGTHDVDAHDVIKWSGGSAAANGVIYCLPCNTDRILAIDPL